MDITLQGDGPFDLPVSQRARADAGSDAVTLTFRVLATPSQPVTVRIAVPNSQALEFASQIAKAATDKWIAKQ